MNRILIVDDEPYVVSALRRLFRRANFEIATASSGAEALEALGPFKADVVLSDFRMPNMNGVELLTEVRRRLPHSVRIVLSGYADLESSVGPENAAAITCFMCKPWSDETLVSAVLSMLNQRAIPLPGRTTALRPL